MGNDNYRPAQYQINNIFHCDTCGKECEQPSEYGKEPCPCSCGSECVYVEESYPGDVDEWDEQRDPDGEWRERRR